MREQTVRTLVEVAHELGLEATPRWHYSGRAMYGKTTAGIVMASEHDLAVLVAHASYRLGEGREEGSFREFVQDVRKVRADSMGLDVILY